MEPAHSLTLISHNDAMCQVLARVDMIANADSSVLLVGETGAGKDLFAEYSHKKTRVDSSPGDIA